MSMPYLVDGHNLIPKLGLRLDSPDDEMELAAILQEFTRLERKQVEVYFDGAPAGHAGSRRLGTVKAHFVPLGQTADDAIRVRLKKLGREAKNWIVVSSDHEVQNEARAAQAQALSSEEFAAFLKQARASVFRPNNRETKLSQAEIEEWLELFNKGRE
jgi:predicted RNA-binding protein with PIN domain